MILVELCESYTDLVLVVGGGTTTVSKTAELVDLSLNPENNCPQPADPPVQILRAVGAFVNGRATVCGGEDNPNCYYYDFQIGRWLYTFPLDTERWYSASAVIDDNTWWIAGGEDRSTGPLGTSIVYSGSGFFRPGPELPEPAFGACALKLNATHVFYAGGRNESFITAGAQNFKTAYLLEWATGTWTRLPDMPTGAGLHTCSQSGGEVYVLGGFTFTNVPSVSFVFSLETMTWRDGPAIPVDDIIYYGIPTIQHDRDSFTYVGGHLSGGSTSGIFTFDDKSFGWKVNKKSLSEDRGTHVAIPVPRDVANC